MACARAAGAARARGHGGGYGGAGRVAPPRAPRRGSAVVAAGSGANGVDDAVDCWVQALNGEPCVNVAVVADGVVPAAAAIAGEELDAAAQASVAPALLDAANGALPAGAAEALEGIFKASDLADVHVQLPTVVTSAASAATSFASDFPLLTAALASYAFLSPGPYSGVLYFYVARPVLGLFRGRFSEDSFVTQQNLGGGNFGRVDLAEGTGRDKREYVLKRTRRDSLGEARRDFLSRGTIAVGAAETSVAERYMNERMAVSMPGVGAPYLGSFETGDGTGQVLVWKFDGALTLDDAMRSRAPLASLDAWLRGREQEGLRDEGLDLRRRKEVVRKVMKQLLAALKKLDAAGIVHRDVKPANLLLGSRGRLRVIDMGAAADLRAQVNFNPDQGFFDPVYSPPELLCVPKKTPRATVPAIATLASPVLYGAFLPGCFDTFSAGLVLLQLAIPQLKNREALQRWRQRALDRCGGDLREARRSGMMDGFDTEILDANGGAGWALAETLIAPRGSLWRGRATASEALRSRFINLPF